MEQEKIGKFIATLRKEKNMTQMELANRIQVSDRTISKWERGRGLPELSLLVPLCEVLEISVNELLSGERLSKEVYQEHLEENILNTIEYSEKKIKRNVRGYQLVLGVILVIIVGIGMMFGIDIHRMRNNEPVVFSTWGYSYVPPIDLHEEYIDIAIKEYILDQEEKSDEKWFTAFRTYLIEEKQRHQKYILYCVVVEESYSYEEEVILESASIIPYQFIVEVIDEEYTVTSARHPRDGSLYTEDMKVLFPSYVHEEIDQMFVDGTVPRLQLEIQEQVKLYYHTFQ
ncbi:MAG: helix-turn-helix transcriptional regulator [Erysipelotrichaceae bacterium]|nr:helix-turn-helix transcriptional regulator [Erysipelotrichaceae bacterium]